MDRLLHCGGDGAEVAGVANLEVLKILLALSVGDVVESLWVFLQTSKLYIFHDANNLNIVRGIWRPDVVVMSDGVALGEHGARHTLTDDAYLLRCGSIVCVEGASSQKRDLHRCKVSVADDVMFYIGNSLG